MSRGRRSLLPAIVATALALAIRGPILTEVDLDVLPERDCYTPGTLVAFSLRNAGNTTISWSDIPPDTRIYDGEGQLVSIFTLGSLDMYLNLGPGDTYGPMLWNQTYLLVDDNRMPVPPSFAQVPTGSYTIVVQADAPQGTMGKATVRIADDCTALAADAGPDQVVHEGQPVVLRGRATGAAGGSSNWTLVADIPTERQRLAAASLDGLVYAMGGDLCDEGCGSVPNATVEAYDPSTNQWSARASLPSNRTALAGASAQGFLFTFGGWSSFPGPTESDMKTVLAYDPGVDRWAPRAPMPTGRGMLAAASIGGRAYALGGIIPNARWQLTTTSDANEEYDPVADAWTARSPMPTPRHAVAAAVLGGRIYVLGGLNNASYPMRAVDVYDPATDSWSSAAPLPFYPSWGMAAVAFGGRIYAASGGHGLDCVGSTNVAAYDPLVDAWTTLPSLRIPRRSFAIAELGGTLYAVGGTRGWMCGNVGPTEAYPLGGEAAYAWDLNDRVDADRDGNATDDADALGPEVTTVYGDDGAYVVTLRATLGNQTATDTAVVTVLNDAPQVDRFDVSLVGGEADLGLRVAGRKWNAANLTLYRNGTLAAAVEVVRDSGSPDEQITWIPGPFDGSSTWRAVVAYEPADLDGEEAGANPVWLVVRDASRAVTIVAHHTFNVVRSEGGSDRWNHIDPWSVDLTGRLASNEAVLWVEARDNGSDDLTFRWSSGAVDVVFNDGVGPDSPNSPWGTFPFVALDGVKVPYVRGATVVVQIEDDDGGSLTAVFSL